MIVHNDSYVGRPVVISAEIRIGDIVRIDEDESGLLVRRLEPWESLDALALYRVEAGSTKRQIRIRRVRHA